jgi:acyl-CoA synthetase (NDP forming)/GNAT superfamily N-acetyltransferase
MIERAGERGSVNPAYSPHWESDVVLADGGTVHLRPIQPEDAERLVALHSRLSPESIRYRYFAPHPELSPREVDRFTNVDYDDRIALVAVLGEELVAVGRYDRTPGTDMAEVAFVVDDAHQGRGLGSVLLEHLAAVAAERGIRRFEAEVLADNMRMLRIFVDAGYQASRSYEMDVVHLVFPIEPTSASLAVMQSREHRAEARSIARLLTPRSVAVIGASRNPESVGHAVLVNLLRSGFQGPVYPINPRAGHVASVRSYPSVGDVPEDVDLAVLAIPAPAVVEVIEECARKGVRGLVVMSGGFSEVGPAGLAPERALVATARANGMRLIGPNCLGVMNTASDVRLNASLAPALPGRGRAGFLSESGALGLAILESLRSRELGLSTFVSAGNRADVSGNDLLQYWEDDPATDVVLLHFESFGNPRKFARLARRLGKRKPIVAVKSGGAVASRLTRAADPDRVVDALFRQAGVIRVDTLAQLFDVAQVLTTQPLPAGRRVAVVGNSAAPARLAADACGGNGLEVAPLSDATRESLRSALGPDVVIGNPLVLKQDSGPAAFDSALSSVLADPVIDAVVTLFIPALYKPDTAVAKVLSAASTNGTKPVVSVYLGFGGFPLAPQGDPGDAPPRGSVPSFPSPDVAVAALARTAAYAEWRRRREGVVPVIAGVDEDGARELVTDALRASPEGGPLLSELVNRLLAMYGVRVWPAILVASVEEAVAGAAEVGYPVALKATAESLRHRPELGTVRLDIASEDELRAAYQAMTERLGGATAGLAVQAMAPPGVAVVVRTAEDPSFGALVSFGVSGVATDLLGDHAFRILPLTDVDAAELVRTVRAAPLLFGYRGTEPVDVAALEQLLLRVGRLADDLPEVAELELNPVIVGPSGTSVLRASARIAVPTARLDAGPRRMR